MCGIVAAVSSRNIVPILIEGLRRLEYRGYDSCGVALHQDGELRRARSTARVAELAANVEADRLQGGTGIAHTRWATHGAPVVHNAHPHFSHGPRVDTSPIPAKPPASPHRPGRPGPQRDHREPRRAARRAAGAPATCSSRQTDTEVIAHLVDRLTTATCSRRCSAPCRGCAAPTPSPCSAATSRIAWSARARARRWSWASAAGRRQRDLPRFRRDGARRRHRPDRLPGRGRRRRPPARQALDPHADAQGTWRDVEPGR